MGHFVLNNGAKAGCSAASACHMCVQWRSSWL